MVRHMKQSGGPASSTFVTPKSRRKPGGTDFTNRRARKRRALRKKVVFPGEHLSAPVKRRGEGLPVALKFCSIRKLILGSIVEEVEEVIEKNAADDHEEEQEVLVRGVACEAMTEELVFNCSQRVESPQPSIRFYDSSTGGADSKSDHNFNSVEVSILKFI